MYVACLPPDANAAAIHRALNGVPELAAVILPAGVNATLTESFPDMLRALRRQLYLVPELRVLLTVPGSAVEQVVRQIAASLVEGQCGSFTVGQVAGHDISREAVQWIEDGTLKRRDGTAPLPAGRTLTSAHIQFGAAPFVEACESGCRVVVGGRAARGSLALAAIYEALELEPRHWDRLAAVSAICQLVEFASTSEPLWLELTDQGGARCVGLDETLGNQLHWPQSNEDHWRLNPDVLIESGHYTATDSGGLRRHEFRSAVGAPPAGVYEVTVELQAPASEDIEVWPATIPKSAVEWDVVVRTASDWVRA